MKKGITAILVIAMILTVVFSKDIIENIRQTIDLCIYTLTPSLFPFLVISKMTMLSGCAGYIGRLCHPVTSRLFSLSENGSFLFLIGIICGYPVGAKSVADMIKDKEITVSEGERLILFCNNSGPLFVIGAVGYGMFFSTEYGIILYISHILSAMVIGIFMRKKVISDGIIKHSKNQPYFTKAVEESIFTVINISAYVIFFASVCAIINNILPNSLNIIKFIICSSLEVTGGIKNLSLMTNLTIRSKLIITSFLIGFGGICIIMQTKGVISGSGLKIYPYICAKICQGAMSSIFTSVFLHFIPVKVITYTHYPKINMTTILLIISLVVMCIYFFKLSIKRNINHHNRI